MDIVNWLHQAIVFGAFLMLAALGELLTEKAGNLNLGTAGIMCVGAASGIAGLDIYKSSGGSNTILLVLISLGAAFAAAAFMGLIYSFFTTTLRINQNVVGLVLTIFGTGMAKFMSATIIKIPSSGNVRFDDAYGVFNTKIPFLSDKLGIVSKLLFSYGFMFYLTIIIIVGAAWFLSKTRFGLALRAVGENPGTADAAGINVIKYKYVTSCIGSGLTGIAGIFCVMEFKSGSWSTTDISSIEAFGWLAVALVIFAMWKPLNLIWGSIVFGAFYWIYQYIHAIPIDLTQMLPYIVTIIVLIVVSLRSKKENQGPASLGLSYFREDR
ncbi:MAG: ABC transporter permease [Eubacteriales bacterium]|jgi:ABC-type uncharacterized transport system permease subunit